jgi:hypothetical protein
VAQARRRRGAPRGLERSFEYARAAAARAAGVAELSAIVERAAVERAKPAAIGQERVLLPYLLAEKHTSYGRHFSELSASNLHSFLPPLIHACMHLFARVPSSFNLCASSAPRPASLSAAPCLSLHRRPETLHTPPRLQLLDRVVERCLPFLRAGDTAVDFSCGANERLPGVRRAAAAAGVPLATRACDVLAARGGTDSTRKPWWGVETGRGGAGGLRGGAALIIGLDPPFGGPAGRLASQWARRTARLRPGAIVLIVPPQTKVPEGYEVAFEDRALCDDRVGAPKFFCPAWTMGRNVEPPALRVLLRRADREAHARRPDGRAGARRRSRAVAAAARGAEAAAAALWETLVPPPPPFALLTPFAPVPPNHMGFSV